MRITTVDGHVAGGAVRLVTGGLPTVTGDSLAARAEALAGASGSLLQSLAREPRGHAGTVVAVLVEPERPEADAGLVFLRGDGRVDFEGHALIGATALALEAMLLQPRRPGRVLVDTMAGPIEASISDPLAAGALRRLAYTGPPVRVLRANQPVAIARRTVHADIVWTASGTVAIVDAEAAGAPLVAARALELGRVGADVLRHLAEAVRVADPESGRRAAIESAVFIGAAPESGADVRSASVASDGVVSRSPDARATCAIAAVLTAMGMLAPGQRLVHQGLLGATLDATIVSQGDAEGRPLVEIEVEAETWPTGEHAFCFEPGDPLRDGIEVG